MAVCFLCYVISQVNMRPFMTLITLSMSVQLQVIQPRFFGNGMVCMLSVTCMAFSVSAIFLAYMGG